MVIDIENLYEAEYQRIRLRAQDLLSEVSSVLKETYGQLEGRGRGASDPDEMRELRHNLKSAIEDVQRAPADQAGIAEIPKILEALHLTRSQMPVIESIVVAAQECVATELAETEELQSDATKGYEECLQDLEDASCESLATDYNDYKVGLERTIESFFAGDRSSIMKDQRDRLVNGHLSAISYCNREIRRNLEAAEAGLPKESSFSARRLDAFKDFISTELALRELSIRRQISKDVSMHWRTSLFLSLQCLNVNRLAENLSLHDSVITGLDKLPTLYPTSTLKTDFSDVEKINELDVFITVDEAKSHFLRPALRSFDDLLDEVTEFFGKELPEDAESKITSLHDSWSQLVPELSAKLGTLRQKACDAKNSQLWLKKLDQFLFDLLYDAERLNNDVFACV